MPCIPGRRLQHTYRTFVISKSDLEHQLNNTTVDRVGRRVRGRRLQHTHRTLGIACPVCMLQPPPAHTEQHQTPSLLCLCWSRFPRTRRHKRFMFVLLSLCAITFFCNADCPVCMLEPPPAYTGRRQTATLPCVCWSPLPRTRRTERYTVVLFSLCATSDFITPSFQCVCWSLLPHTRGNARPQPYRVYAGAASRVHAGQNSHRGVVSVFSQIRCCDAERPVCICWSRLPRTRDNAKPHPYCLYA